MAIPAAQKLLESAQKGEKKLTAKERRHVVAYLMGTSPDTTNVEMAETFGVGERTIRLDKKAIREEKSKLIKEDDVGLVIADILLDYERAIREIEKSLRASKIGSQVRLNHITTQMDLRLKTTKALQDLGWLPKNLGNLTMDKFEYRAIVNKQDGSVEVRKVDMFDQLHPVKQLGDGADTRAALDAEFTDLPSEAAVSNGESSSRELPKSIEGSTGSGEEASSNPGTTTATSEAV